MSFSTKQILKIQFLKLGKNGHSLSNCQKFPVEFHISRNSRDKYKFDDSIFESDGNVIIADFHAARLFAKRMNDERDLIHYPELAVRAGEINAMGLIDEILHLIMQLYRIDEQPKVLPEALTLLEREIGKDHLDKALNIFAEEFPSVKVYKNEISLNDYLEGETEGIPNRQIILEEVVMLWLANMNPAFSPFSELFEDQNLEGNTSYLKMMSELYKFFDTQPTFGPKNQNLLDLLQTPGREHPNSLEDQLEYIRNNWGMILEKLQAILGKRLLLARDFLREEQKMRFHPSLGAAITETLEFLGMEEEPERFSPDLHWMPKLVLLAKSTLVWLDQLSKKYQWHIYRLDQIPDEELDKIARWGFTGLWLIGVWERGQASKEIKQMCGNPEAEASAYSLKDYNIAPEIGGSEAYQNLKDRCWKRGIRLASDMVPNHMAIDSRWVIEHPHWFLQLNYPPFPAYTYNGPNFSDDSRVGIYIEDHYFNRSDAAVTFKRVDFHTGDTRYIYHGNDGTSTPWNDTAQLNYLLPEVREALIQTILHVARQFSIIRFDAAMTLAKKHYQRLWFPPPGSGGDIPSRAEHGLSNQEFNSQFPVEFWREVVDRIAVEAPDTLLLAEAFWLMEGYFVRTLGMHRVYNSAFMNMLRNEENKKYRYTIKNTLEFNPEILKRYVNFMNNPDEETAISQFGDGDKYFGVCTMMLTMPGLPMMGHGQIEGFHEKYGMEYRRAYYDEIENQHLIDRHEREIFPLIKKRYLFAEVHNFLLYDFYTPNGEVNENVFAYSNRFHNERSLVVYNNIYGETWGWIRISAAYAVKTGNGDEQKLIQKMIGEGLGLPNDGGFYCIFRDQVTGLEYIRNCQEIWNNGFYLEIKAFQYHVFLDFRIVHDNEWQHYAHLTAHLEGRGTPNIEEALMEVYLKPIHYHLRELLKKEILSKLQTDVDSLESHKDLLHEIGSKYYHFISEAKNYTSGKGNEQHLLEEFLVQLASILELGSVQKRYPYPRSIKYKDAIEFLNSIIPDKQQNTFKAILWSWVISNQTGKLNSPEQYELQSRSYIDEWLIGKIIIQMFNNIGADEYNASRFLTLIKILVTHQNWFNGDYPKTSREYHIFYHLLHDREVQQFLQINKFEDKLWYNKESFEILCQWLFIISVIHYSSQKEMKAQEVASGIAESYGIVCKWLDTEKKSEYQVEKLLDGLKTKRKSRKKSATKKK
jgi:glycosidase